MTAGHWLWHAVAEIMPRLISEMDPFVQAWASLTMVHDSDDDGTQMLSAHASPLAQVVPALPPWQSPLAPQ